VVGYEGIYEVSDCGRLRSYKRSTVYILEPYSSRQGYLFVSLSNSDKQRKRWAVHRLVLLAFVGEPPIGQGHGAHRDGDRKNNRIGNLSWLSAKENMADRYIHGTDPRGGRNPFAKLTESQVIDIRARVDSGQPAKAVAAQYGVNVFTVLAVHRRRSWAHI
jgi:hypothetical protein